MVPALRPVVNQHFERAVAEMELGGLRGRSNVTPDHPARPASPWGNAGSRGPWR